jgi:hypothetical protein
MSVEKLVKDSINDRKKIEEKVKADVETILKGFSITTLDDISSQLNLIGQSFVDNYLKEISDTADAGVELANSISGLAEKRDRQNQ